MTSSALEKVAIKAIPERPAVAASESLSEFSVLVGLKAPSLSDDARRRQRAPIDLVTVLDVSGSMYGKKLSLMKTAVHFIIDNLGPPDRLSIVSFNCNAQTISPLSNMTEVGRENARLAVDRLYASGGTNIVDALKMGVKVLEDRSQPNPVSTIIFLSDGLDNYNYTKFPTSRSRGEPEFLGLLPFSIFPRNRGAENSGQQAIFPVHTFGFGNDHDPFVMHAIADASAGTFSFIQSHVMLQDAFACCIGGLLSVVTKDLCLNLRSASHGVEINSIPSGRYASEISDGGSRGVVKICDLYAEEEKEFLINILVPSLANADGNGKTSLLDITCSYRDMVLDEMVQIQVDLVEIGRPESVSPQDMAINLEVERQRNRLLTLLTITEAQQMAETGDMEGAQAVLSKGRSMLIGTACAQAGDPLCMWLDAEMEETRQRMATSLEYMQHGRAYALAGMSSHAYQRAATRGNNVPGAAEFESSPAYGCSPNNSPTYSPTGYSPTSPAYSCSGDSSPTAPAYGCALPCGNHPAAPGYVPSWPIGYTPSSPGYAPTAPAYGCSRDSSPSYSPKSPGYSPTAPAYSCSGDSSPSASPAYGCAKDPTAPGYVPSWPTAPSYGCALPCGNPPSYNPPGYAAYVTPSMANMVAKSKQQCEAKRVSGTDQV